MVFENTYNRRNVCLFLIQIILVEELARLSAPQLSSSNFAPSLKITLIIKYFRCYESLSLVSRKSSRKGSSKSLEMSDMEGRLSGGE